MASRKRVARGRTTRLASKAVASQGAAQYGQVKSEPMARRTPRPLLVDLAGSRWTFIIREGGTQGHRDPIARDNPRQPAGRDTREDQISHRPAAGQFSLPRQTHDQDRQPCREDRRKGSVAAERGVRFPGMGPSHELHG